jgi:hypothetical protein
MISLPKATARLYGNTGHPIEKNPGRRGDKQRGDPISEPTRGTPLLEKVKRYSLVSPFKDDTQNLSTILHGFGEVTGLCTNFQKSSVVPIRCGQVDLDGLQVERVSFQLRDSF